LLRFNVELSAIPQTWNRGAHERLDKMLCEGPSEMLAPAALARFRDDWDGMQRVIAGWAESGAASEERIAELRGLRQAMEKERRGAL
jgi:hypothetical protein